MIGFGPQPREQPTNTYINFLSFERLYCFRSTTARSRIIFIGCGWEALDF